MMTNTRDEHDLATHLRTGFDFLAAGQNQAALDLFYKLVNHDQGNVHAWSGLGAALDALGDPQGAAQSYRNALQIEPKLFAVQHELGRILMKSGEAEEAAQCLSSALELNPGSEQARCDLGTALMATNDLIQAEECFRNALALNPTFTTAHINLGNCLREQLKLQEAAAIFDHASKLNPQSTALAARLSSTLSDLGQTDDAISVLDRILANQPDSVECHQNKALILLRAERFEQGFAEYEWRRYPSAIGVKPRPFSMPSWRGEDLAGKSLLIWLEQGIGDEILALGLWDTLLTSNLAKQHIVECDPRLAALLRRSFPDTTVVPRQDPPAAGATKADLVCPAWSGGQFLCTTEAALPKRPRYLHAAPEAVSVLREKYAALADGRKIVGLSWGSGAQTGHLKSPPLEAWHPVIADQSLFLVSLQYEPANSDLQALSVIAGQNIHVDPDIDVANDLDGGAAQISAMDAVVTISNTTAHLAGALGAPTATIIPSGYGAYWYWFQKRTDSPWYPAMTMCRQKHPGDWPSAMLVASEWLAKTDLHYPPLP